MKKLISLAAAALALVGTLALPVSAQVNVEDPDYYTRFKGQGKSINVHNWGEYISDGTDGGMDIIQEFEDLTGIQVNYTTFSTNEEVYARLRNGGASYDLLFPSDYMMSRMIQEGMLNPLNFDNLPNYKYIDESFRNTASDPENLYSTPYTWGTVVVIYNTTMVDEMDLGSWDILWNEKYLGEILMIGNSRDTFGIALKRLGYPMNPENQEQLDEALESLKDQKPLTQAYVMDEIFDKMIGGEASIAPYYAGDALTMMADNPDLSCFVPEEGTNRFIDYVVVPSCSKEQECAEMFMNFLMEPEVAAANIEYIGYSSPNWAALELLPPEVTENPVAYPPDEVIAKTEAWINLSDEMNLAVDKAWTDLLSSDEEYNRWLIPILMLLAILASIAINVGRAFRRRREKAIYESMSPGKRL